MGYIEGVPPLFIDELEVPPVISEEKYLMVKEVIAKEAFGRKEDFVRVIDDAYIAVPENEGGLGVDSLGLVEIIMEVEDILETQIPDDQAEVVGQVFHVAHLYNVRERETQIPGTLERWLEIRKKEIKRYVDEHPEKERMKK